jgi:site-specific DNA recombinase
MPQSTNPNRTAAVYVRVSTAAQGQDGTSLATQEAGCRVYAAEQGYTLAEKHVFREQHSGADLHERPRLAAARALLRSGDVGILVCYAVDRLSRKQAHVAIVADEADRAGARLEFVTEDFEQSAVGEFIRSAKAFAAEMEREKTLERTLRGKRAKVEGAAGKPGKPLGTGRAPYGLQWRDAAKSGYEPNPATIGHLHRIFADYDRGSSLRRLAMALEADGVLPPYHDRTGGTLWSVSSLRHILQERAYTGAGDAYRWQTVKLPGGGRARRPRPEAERTALPAGVFPQVISPAQFEQVQQRLQRNKRESIRPDRNPEVGILRRGYVVCGSCGHRMLVAYRRDIPGYRCHSDGRRLFGCDGVDITVAQLDAAVWSWVEDILTKPEHVALHVARLRRNDPTEHDLGGVDRQLALTTKQQASVAQAIAMLAGNPDGLAPLVTQLDALGKQRHALESERAQLLARQTGWQAAESRLDSIAGYCERVAANLGTLTFAERRRALDALGVSVEVNRSGQAPRWIITSAIRDDAPSGNMFSTCRSAAGCDKGRRE